MEKNKRPLIANVLLSCPETDSPFFRLRADAPITWRECMSIYDTRLTF